MLVVSDLAIGNEKKRIPILDTLFLEGVQFGIYIQQKKSYWEGSVSHTLFLSNSIS